MPKRNHAPVRALVVDDLPDSSESLARMLQLMGCAATYVTRATKAMDAAEALEAEIVFLDIGMPEIDGYELARSFRKRYGDAIRLVAVTGYGDEDHHKQSREAGFDAHVTKPIDLAIVESMLRTVLASRR
jgi:CheY-like chemotaxis protein